MKTGLKKKIFSKRNRMLVLLAILVFSASLYIIPGGKDVFRKLFWNCVPISIPREVKAFGMPAEMGKTYGEELKYSVRILSTVYIRKIICGGDAKKFENNLLRAKKLLSGIDHRWIEEIEAIASASGADADDLMIGNTFLDLGLYSAGCRQIISIKNGRLLHAHNMDWDNLGGFGHLMVTILRRNPEEGRFRTVTITFPGMVGALDIINEKGISLSFNQVGHSRGVSKMPVFIKMRDIAETCASFEEAEMQIMNMPQGMPFIIGLADAGNCKSAVFERDDEKTVLKREPVDGMITADNSTWCKRSLVNCSVDRIARKNSAFDIEPIVETLRNSQVLLECDIYSLIWDFKNNSFHLACGEIPAAKGKYRRFKLF